MTQPKRIAVLGATGSIGRQALQVIADHPEHFEITLLSAHSSVEAMHEVARRLTPKAMLMADAKARDQLAERLEDLPIHIASLGDFKQVLEIVPVDLVLVAIVGFAGLKPTLTAIEAGKHIALANKETLVAGGALVMQALKDHNVHMYPVDSEHSAIFQCLMGESMESVEQITLTASGGPFWNQSLKAMRHITPSHALQHPTWEMGQKVTIDSATMMNKGLEVIEAYWLFGVPLDRIQIRIHRQSWVHAWVRFIDGSQKAQLAPADMRIPIQLALSYPKRLPLALNPLDLAQEEPLSFFEPDASRFSAPTLCYDALHRGGNIPCALNAANECAVEAFLQEELPFLGIMDVVRACVEKVTHHAEPTYEDLFETDAQSRIMAKEMITLWKD